MELEVAPINGYERRKASIRQKILDAAEALIRETGGTDFSVRVLAARAEVSPATPFNHLGSKTGIFAALVVQSLQQQQTQYSAKANAIEKLVEGMLAVTAIYSEEPKLYRPVFKQILGSLDKTNPSVLLAVGHLSGFLEEAQANHQLQPDINIQLVAEQLESYWIGTLLFWVTGSMPSDEWQLKVEHGLCLILTGLVSTKLHKKMLTKTRKAATSLAGLT